MRISEDLNGILSEEKINEIIDIERTYMEYESISRRMFTNGETGLSAKRNKSFKKYKTLLSKFRKIYSPDKFIITKIRGGVHSILFCTKEYFIDNYGEEMYQEYYEKHNK